MSSNKKRRLGSVVADKVGAVGEDLITRQLEEASEPKKENKKTHPPKKEKPKELEEEVSKFFRMDKSIDRQMKIFLAENADRFPSEKSFISKAIEDALVKYKKK